MRKEPSYSVAATQVIALLIVVANFLLPYISRHLGADWNEAAIALLGTIAVVILYDGNAGDLGFRRTPLQGWWHWIKITLWLGLCVALIVLICGAVALAMGWEIPIRRANPRFLLYYLLFMGIYAPLVEEVIFRFLLAVACRSLLGDKGFILLSGFLFAAAHWGGNPSPENQVGGFLLAWAFVRSQTILVPLAMHSAGNLIALSVQIINWYVF